MTKIVVVGSLNMDLVVRVPKIPEPGETILGNGFATFPGGKGANQAVAAARLGADVTMIGQVGSDSFGEALIENLNNEGVQTEFVAVDRTEATGVALITVDADGQNSIAVASGANYTFTSKQVNQAWNKLNDVDILVMPLETPPDTIIAATKLARESHAKVILNPAPARPLTKELLSMIDVIVPNELEVIQIVNFLGSPVNEIQDAVNILLDYGVGAVVTTLGSDGAEIFEKDKKSLHLTQYDVDIVDTTAAGDAFIGAFAVGLGEGKSLYDACCFANAAGALTVTKAGAQPSLPKRIEVDKLLGNCK